MSVAKSRREDYFSLLFRKAFLAFFKARLKVKLGSKRLTREEDIRPFFIIGSGRSGNTLLRRILNNHTELFIPPETYVLGQVIKMYSIAFFVNWDRLVNRVYDLFKEHREYHTFNMDDLSRLKARTQRCRRNQRSLAYLIDQFYLEYKCQHDIPSKRWGDKTPLNTLSLDFISAIFPKGCFIHIIRDPFDSISSYVSSGIYSNVNTATKRWIHSVKTAREFGKKEPNRYIEIKYESLVAEPIEVVKTLCEFLKIEFEEGMLDTPKSSQGLGDVETLSHHNNVLRPIKVDSIGKGKKSLSAKQIEEIKLILSNSNPLFIHEYV